MSIKIMSAVWDVSAFRGNQKLILLCLADFASDEGYAWPSLGTVAKKCGVSKSTLKSQIKTLVDLGVLKVKHRKKENSRDNDSNMYWIDLAVIRKMELTEVENKPRSKTDLGQNGEGGGSNSDPKPPLLDPPLNNRSPLNPPNEETGQNSETQKNRKRTSAKTKFPTQFEVTPEMIDWYTKQKDFVLGVQVATDQWRDAMIARGSAYSDWVAAWRNGMRLQNQWVRERGAPKASASQTTTAQVGQSYRAGMDVSKYKLPESRG
ncbi:helix-turn-helix domain-containing protein [Vibrio metschnikovii]|uniref:helix-turn-helix domain-containing protein n=1 Tax=Vibrio metschnikovii TaxID=28172 RepID=UPI001C2F9FE8|nr:helix-turn-helix domain-containing protein [Vibrio metschnikovii]